MRVLRERGVKVERMVREREWRSWRRKGVMGRRMLKLD